jgi:hypothetical protein
VPARILLYTAVILLLVRAVLRIRWRELARRLDRVINATLIALVLVYSGTLIWWFMSGKR